MTIDDLIEILYRCAKQFCSLIEKKRFSLNQHSVVNEENLLSVNEKINK